MIDWTIRRTDNGYFLRNRTANIAMIGPRPSLECGPGQVAFYTLYPDLETEERLQTVRDLLSSAELASNKIDFVIIDEHDFALIRLASR